VGLRFLGMRASESDAPLRLTRRRHASGVQQQAARVAWKAKQSA